MSKPSLMHADTIRRSRYAPHALATTLTLALALSGCGQKPEEPAAEPAVAAAAPKVEAAICQASSSWISNPNPPPEIAAAETFCDFYQFSWQWFLAQVSPSTTSPGERVFETNRLHNPNVSSGQCSLPVLLGRAAAAKMLDIRDDKPQDFEDKEADSTALYDQNGNIQRYNIWYSQAMCESTQQGFASGTFEIKVAWKILPEPVDSSYYSMQATLPGYPKPVTLGMVGFHLANWTQNHPEMIWATFEHKTNAPLCDGSSPAPPSGWSYASSDAATCLTNNPQPTSGPPNSACDGSKFNAGLVFKDSAPPIKGVPNNVCRQYAYGNQPGQSVNGNDNAANLLAIQQLNDQLVGTNGLLTKLPDTDPMAIWKHYEMIGGIWTKAGASSGSPPVPSGQGPADPNSPQRGSLELTNMTMETFQQGDTSFIPNCFGCHNFDTTAPLNVSHICASLFSVDSTGKNCVIAATGAGPAAAPEAPAATEKK